MLIGRDKEKEMMDRLSERGNLSGSYLFFGEPRVGKSSFAESFIASLENNASVLTDALIISPDEEKGSIGIDRVREVRGFLSVRPVNSTFRSVLIKDADYMTDEAQNAVLKIVEEPPPHAIIIFTASSPDIILSTLSSRLRRIHFPRIKKEIISRYLVENKGIEKEEAILASSRSFGRPGIALEIVSGKYRENLLPKDLKFDSVPDFRRFIEGVIINLYAEKNNNWRRLGEFTARTALSEKFNVNKKLQLKSMPWIQ